MKRHVFLSVIGLVFAWTWVAHAASDTKSARQILDATGVQGGVVVHLNCGDGALTAALHVSDSYLVHGLDTDASQVAAARQRIRSLGLSGPVSVEQWSGKTLPYIDNFVNLIVGEKSAGISQDELMRVLAPNGVAYLKSGEKWQKLVKPWPKGMDQWTHYLHDPTNNAVSHDEFIEPLGHYQWVAGKRYSRQHDHMSSLSAAVTANGRMFCVFDEAPRASILTPPEWKLIARDAFNGTLLWKRDISRWHQHLWRLKSGPQLMTRRLVAMGDRLYVTLGIDSALSVLDAATGETIRTFEKTKTTEEILCLDDTLILSVAGKDQPLRSDPNLHYTSAKELAEHVTDPVWTEVPRTIMAVDAESGQIRWQRTTNLVSMSLTAGGQRVLFHDGQAIQCLDRRTGQALWTSESLPVRRPMRSSGGATLVVYKDVILYSGQAAIEKYEDNRSTTMFALSVETGKTLWNAEHLPCGHMGTPDDLLVMRGLVWAGAVAKGSDSGAMIGRDLHTGEIKNQFTPDVETHWFHHRCYRAKATDKYLLFSRTGIEFIDPDAQHWTCHHWVRGACLYGILPANGLVYAPPHPCACYIEAKLSGFNALAPVSLAAMPRRDVPDAERLERGPAFDRALDARHPTLDTSSDWPTFRHDAGRSGATGAVVESSGMKQAWTTKLGGKLSSPVIAEGKLFLSATDTDTVHALDAETGESVWSFTVGSRVDSPPTIWHGRALFGCADGYVYCLRATDGQLVWRYRAAPEERNMQAFDRIESVWPVHGSVLVQNDTVYCVAGRSMFLDGGLRLLRLDPRTGHKVSETILDDRDPETGENLQVRIEGLNMPVALPDILSSDGKYVYMRSLPLHLDGTRKFVEYVPVIEQKGDDVHLFSPTGFLDDTLWHRTYWIFGRAFASGAGGYSQAGHVAPAGRLMVFDQKNVFGYGRHSQYYRWTTPLEFELFASAKQPEIFRGGGARKPIKKQGKRTGKARVSQATRFVPFWSDDASVQVTAMVLTKNALFAAGPPDVEDEEVAVNALNDPEIQRKLAEQSAAFEGRRGALLVAVSPTDGKKLAAYRLKSLPRFDSLIAAAGRLYCSTVDGQVICLSPDKGEPLPQAHGAVVTARPRTE